MDPLGFGLENFDPTGRWRIKEAHVPVDASGELPSGEKFNGPSELKELLLRHKDAFFAGISRENCWAMPWAEVWGDLTTA